MTKPKKHATLKTALALTAINLLAFILTYLSSYVSDSAFLIYLSIFASDFLTAAFPVAIAAIATVIYTRCGTQAAFIHGTALVATRAIYFYPLAYLDYIAAGYITVEALLLSVLNTILSLIVIYLEAMLISILILFLTGKIARKKGGKKSSLAELTVRQAGGHVRQVFRRSAGEPGQAQRLHRGDDHRPEGCEGLLP